MKQVYREVQVKLPKLYLASYATLKNCFIVSFQDCLKFEEALQDWDDVKLTHSVIADRAVEVGKLFYVNEDGDVTLYSLKDFEDIKK